MLERPLLSTPTYRPSACKYCNPALHYHNPDRMKLYPKPSAVRTILSVVAGIVIKLAITGYKKA